MRPPGPESPRPPLPHRLLSAVTQADGSQAAPWKRELTLHTKAWPPHVPCRAWGPGPGSGMIRCTNRPAAPASSSPPTRAGSGHAGHTTRRPRGPRGLPGRPGCPLLALLPPATAPAATLPELAGRLPCPRPRTWPCVGRGGPPWSACSGHRLSESLPRSLMVSGLHSAARAAWDHTQTVSRGSGAALPLPVSKGRRPGHALAPQATWSRPAGSQSLPGPEPQDPRQPLLQTLLPLPGHAPPGPTCLASPRAADPCSTSQGRLGQAPGTSGQEQRTGSRWEGGIGRGTGAPPPGSGPGGGSHLQGSQRAPRVGSCANRPQTGASAVRVSLRTCARRRLAPRTQQGPGPPAPPALGPQHPPCPQGHARKAEVPGAAAWPLRRAATCSAETAARPPRRPTPAAPASCQLL